MPAVFVVSLLLSAHNAGAGLPTNGMVLYYSFDTDQGVQVLNECRGGNTGTVAGATWSSFGLSRGAFSFDGTNDSIHAGAMTNWTVFTNGFSLSFWTRQTAPPEVRGAYYAGTLGPEATNRLELGCNFVSSGQIVFRLYDSEGNVHYRSYAPGLVDDGEWHHVAMLVGTNATGIRLLLDSVEMAPSETSGTVFRLTGLNFPLVVGSAGDGGGGISSTNSLNGFLEDFRIFNRLLTTGEAQALYDMMEGEPDDTLWEARLISPGQTQNHTMKALDDEDWEYFYTVTNVTNYVFSTKNNGTNVDTQITVYRPLEDDTLGLVTSVNNTAMGLGLGESWTLANDSNELYYVKISTPTGLYGLAGKAGIRVRLSGGDAGFGEGSAYSSELAGSPALVNSIIVAAHAHPGDPAASWARVDEDTQNFVDGFALTFPGLSVGLHSVRVGWRTGVRPREHPSRPGQIQNAGNVEYGNPRTIVLSGSPAFALVSFLSEPVNYQQATVRDAHTGAHLKNVSVTCISDSAPFSATETRRGHAAETSYQQLWKTLSDGSFPTNLMLWPTSWDLILSATDYSNRTLPNAVSDLPWGHTNNLGEILLYPVDLNGNGIGDAWERRYFPPEELPVDPWDDEDEDGLNNWSEYMAGTDPTLPGDRLELNLSTEYSLIRLRWNGQPWRRYRVAIEATPPSNGMWDGETDTVTHWGTSSWEQVWSDLNWSSHSQRVYRLEVIPPGE